MSYTSETPFDNIENSHQYVSLLAEAIEEARREVDEEIAFSMSEGAERRKEALQIVAYNLAKLSYHEDFPKVFFRVWLQCGAPGRAGQALKSESPTGICGSPPKWNRSKRPLD